MLIIRQANKDDAKEILAVYTPYITNTAITFETEVPSIMEFENRIDSILCKYPYFVVEDESSIIGYVYASAFHERNAYRYNVDWSIYLKKEYHGKHLGSLLFNLLVEVLKKQGFLKIFSLVTSDNKGSIALHNALHFRITGIWEKVGYKFNSWYDVHLFEFTMEEKEIPQEITWFSSFPKEQLDTILKKYNILLQEEYKS